MDVQVPSEIVLKEIEKIENQFPSALLFERALAMQKLTPRNASGKNRKTTRG